MVKFSFTKIKFSNDLTDSLKKQQKKEDYEKFANKRIKAILKASYPKTKSMKKTF